MRPILCTLLAGCIGGDIKTDGTTDTDTIDDTTTAVDCETLEGTCGNLSTGDTGCPEGFQCWGPSAFVCFRGTECDLPICLPATASIATPSGDVPIASLRVGDPVFTMDAFGERVPAQVVRLGSVVAPERHRVVRVVLEDGRTLRASPGHPTADGRTLADLRPGEPWDESVVVHAALEPYGEPRTYDLLPSGPTGAYWVEGILLGSTLAGPSSVAELD